MDELTQARLIRSNLLTQLVNYSTKTPINYTIEGQSVSYADLIKNLKEAISSANELIVMFDPFEIRTVQDY